MRSMTGFGRAEGTLAGSIVTVEVKSVNHRYLDLRFRLPTQFAMLESAMAETVRAQFERGAFEVNIRQRLAASEESGPGTTRFLVDETAVDSLMECCDWLHYKYKTSKTPSLEMLAMTGKVFLAVEDSQDTASLLPSLKGILDSALEGLKQMREVEGQRLKTLLNDGAQELLRTADRLTVLAPEQPKRSREKLMQRITQWGVGSPVDGQRLEWEVAFYADRSDITEEIDRLRAHAQEFQVLLQTGKSVGRKLEFLTQELHREANTLGSKATAIEITHLTVEAKTCIEKLREQVQNVE